MNDSQSIPRFHERHEVSSPVTLQPLAVFPLAGQFSLNTSTSIHQLPPEILAYVLKFLPEDAVGLANFPEFEGNWPPDPNPWWTSVRWINLLSVSRYWRATLLTFPFLWNTVIIDQSTPLSDKLAQFFIDRAGSLPLLVYATNPTSLKTIAKYSFRLKDFRMLFTDTSVVAPILSSLTSPAPLLESLDICYQRPLQSSTEGGDDSPEHLSIFLPTLFNQQTPLLRNLYFERIFSWGENIFPNLTHIAVQGCETEHVSPQQYAMLLNLLRASPRLEELNLCAPHPWVPDFAVLDSFEPVDFASGVVSLPSLQRLSLIYFAPSQSSFFLPHLDIPRGCSIAISEIAYPEGGLFTSLPNNLTQIGTLEEITSLLLVQIDLKVAHAVAGGPSGYLKISADMEWDESSLTGNEDPKTLFMGHEYHHCTISHLSWHFPVENLTCLWVTGPSEGVSYSSAVSSSWSNVLLRMGSLVSIRIQHRPARDILTAIANCTQQNPGPTCPQLASLYICNTECADPLDDWEALRACVAIRADVGYPLQFVHLASQQLCGISDSGHKDDRKEKWEELKKYVTEVFIGGFGSCGTCPVIEIPVEVTSGRHLFWKDWVVPYLYQLSCSA